MSVIPITSTKILVKFGHKAAFFCTIDFTFCLLLPWQVQLPKYQISKLQKVQNAAARLVPKSKRSDSITPILKRLHWLPVQARIRYKILLITYRALKGLAPDYICTLLKMSSSRFGLRSSSTISLSCPKTRRNWGDRAFVSAAPRLWNALPSNLKMENTYELFKTKLKTFLMNQTFC